MTASPHPPPSATEGGQTGDLGARIAALSPAKRELLERRLRAGRSTPAADGIRRLERDDLIALSFAQQRLWFLEQLEPGLANYNLPLATRLTGAVHVANLERAVNEIVRRHEALRTTFREVDGRPMQVIHPPERVALAVTDLGDVAESEREAEAARLVAVDAQRPFHLERDLPLRASLLRLSAVDHVLLLTMHHIASDGWSMGILHRELSELYAAFCSGRAPDLPQLAVQYADFAEWQRGRLQGAVLDDLLSFWKRQLAAMPALLELPLDRPRPGVQVFEGASYATSLPMALLEDLKQVCREADVTLFVGLLAAFELLLARYSGQTDVVVGTPVANRTRVEVEALIGFFVNTLVLRADLSGDPTFLEVLARCRKVSLDALGHQELPFEKLVEAIGPERNLSHNPLFQVMFALQNQGPALEAQHGGPQFAVGTSKFDLTLSTAETTTGLQTAFEYNSALFDNATIVVIASNYRSIVEAAVARPERRMSELLRATAEQHRGSIVEWGAEGAAVDEGAMLHELCERQAALRPDALAVQVVGGESLTYGELDARAELLAAELVRRGVGSETRVGLCVERSAEFVVGVLGILKSGAAFVPLDPAYPADRLQYMLEDCRAPVLLTQEHLLGSLPRFRGTLLCLDDDRLRAGRWPVARVEAGIHPDNLAYVVYTSGSTGRPKGVMVSHRGLRNLAEAQARAFGFGGEDRILQFSALGFDAVVFELTMTLRAGATLCVAPTNALLAGAPLVETLREQRINVVTITPSALAVLAQQALPDLHTLVAASEPCHASLVARWAAGRRFFNAYGPTEATVWATVAKCSDPRATPPIGRPILCSQAYVLDEHMEPVPSGVPGELYIGGAGVARGYDGQPALTAERFLPDPFAPAGQRMYRSGDRVRRLADGQIQFLGRADGQLKVRGYRVELGEIEACLLDHPLVHEAAAVAQPTPGAGMRLVACYVSHAESPSPAQLRVFLARRLPGFMLPASFVPVDAIPSTANGKVDRHALLAMVEEAGQAAEPTGAQPSTETEKAVAAIWCDLLGLDTVGLADDFFVLGGHSLLATQVAARVNDAFGIELPLRRVFEASVLASLADVIDAARADASAACEPPIVGLARDVVSVAVDAEGPR